MMRDMSYRDKMILLIITVIIIIAVGFFALIRPKYNDMVADRGIYEATKEEWEGIDMKLQQIPTLKQTITDDYKDAREVAEMFVNEAFQPVNDTFDNSNANLFLDQYIQPLLDECDLKVETLAPSGIGSDTISYYYKTPNVLTYSLLENADINGNYAQQVADLMAESTNMSERTSADLMTNSIALNVTGTKENLMLFLAKINGEEEVQGGEDGLGSDIGENAVLVNSINITDYTFGAGQTRTITEEQTGADGTVTTVTREVPVSADGKGESSMTINVTFYNAKPIDEPVLGD